MRRPEPSVGDRFGRLVVTSDRVKVGDHYKLGVVCDCKVEKLVSKYSLLNGLTKSCGCMHREATAKLGEANLKHGKTESPAYSAWSSMRQRCKNKNDKDYKRYGGRGIEVCVEWEEFENFYIDMGDPPKGMSLDRADNSKNYSKDNCRWATPKQQANNRRSSRKLEYRGATYSWETLAKEFGINVSAMMKRVARKHSSTLEIRKLPNEN